MRKIVGRILLALGAFLLVAGVLTTAWAPGVVKKTPIDVDSTTRLEGTATKLGDTFPIKVTSKTKSDTEASTDSTAVWVNTSCVVDNESGSAPDCVEGSDDRLVSASVDVFATDRVTGLAVDSDALPADAEPHDGLVNKWPFDAEKRTYDYWDGTAGSAVPAEFVEETTIDGLATYHYRVTVEDAPIQIAEGTPGTYSNVVDIYVEPATGAIVNQSQDQQRYLEDGTQVLDLQAEFTADQVATSVSDAKDNAASLELITSTVPLVGFTGGGIALLAGLALLLTGRGRTAPAEQARRKEAVHA